MQVIDNDDPRDAFPEKETAMVEQADTSNIVSIHKGLVSIDSRKTVLTIHFIYCTSDVELNFRPSSRLHTNGKKIFWKISSECVNRAVQNRAAYSSSWRGQQLNVSF